MSAVTIVEPTGVEFSIETTMPTNAHITEITAEHITTLLKLLKSLIEESAGNIISADISSEPTRFIASTIIVAVIIAMSRLYPSDFTPLAFAKFSSNVTENIRL